MISHTAELDYSTMEYLGSIDNPDEIFHAEILLSGLGAIMDVAVAISVGFERDCHEATRSYISGVIPVRKRDRI